MLATVRPRDIAGKTRRRMAAEEIADLVAVDKKLKKIKAELTTAVHARGSALMDIHGVGPAGAARILADVGDIARFPTGTGSPPGPGPRPWTPRPANRSGTGCLGPGTGG